MMSKTVANPSRLAGRVARAAALGLLALAATLLQAREARAQWTQPDAQGNINSTNSGNVGVGTTAPQSSLHVSTASSATGARGIINEQTSNDANGPLLIVRKSRAGSAVLNGDSIGNFYAQAFDGTGWVNGSRLRFSIDGPVSTNNVPTAMEFLTGTTGTTSVERMRITSGGNVGIGIAAPTARLHVFGAGGASGAAAPTAFNVMGGAGGNSANGGGAGGELFLQGGAGGWNTTGGSAYWSGNGGAVNLLGGTGGQHMFGVSHAGTGGVINITGGTGGAHTLSGYAGGGGGSIVLNGGIGGAGTAAGAAGNVILSNLRGNVGIGTLTPAARLSVSDATAWPTSNTGAIYVNASNTIGAGLNLHSSGTGGRNFLLLSTASGASSGGGTFSIYDATLGTAAGYRFVLNSAGSVGIGTLTPSQKLDVAGNVNGTGVGSSRVDLQACKLEYSIVSPK